LRALWAASALGGLGQSLSGTAGALLVPRLGGSEAMAGAPQTLLVVGSATAALTLSALTRRFGRRPALTAGMAVAALGCLVVTVAGPARSLPGALVGSLLMGAGVTAVMLGRYAAADLGPESARARTMASVLMATTVGALAGPNLLAPAGAIAAGLGLPPLVGPYLIAAVGFVAAAGVLSVGLRAGTVGSAPPAEVRAVASRASDSRLGRAGVTGLAVLSGANLVMVAVATMAPLQLHHLGRGLGLIGLVVSAHIAAMFAPSALSGALTDRIGANAVAAGAGATLILACALAARSGPSPALLAVALVLLGIGWNLALVAGSTLLTAGVPAPARPGREGWGEVGMGAAAATGAGASGMVMAAGGFVTLATGAAAMALVLLVGATAGLRRPVAPPRHPVPEPLREAA
jgi:MFS family permease